MAWSYEKADEVWTFESLFLLVENDGMALFSFISTRTLSKLDSSNRSLSAQEFFQWCCSLTSYLPSTVSAKSFIILLCLQLVPYCWTAACPVMHLKEILQSILFWAGTASGPVGLCLDSSEDHMLRSVWPSWSLRALQVAYSERDDASYDFLKKHSHFFLTIGSFNRFLPSLVNTGLRIAHSTFKISLKKSRKGQTIWIPVGF